MFTFFICSLFKMTMTVTRPAMMAILDLQVFWKGQNQKFVLMVSRFFGEIKFYLSENVHSTTSIEYSQCQLSPYFQRKCGLHKKVCLEKKLWTNDKKSCAQLTKNVEICNSELVRVLTLCTLSICIKLFAKNDYTLCAIVKNLFWIYPLRNIIKGELFENQFVLNSIRNMKVKFWKCTKSSKCHKLSQDLFQISSFWISSKIDTDFLAYWYASLLL